tara:strand:- start:134 stop:754 length:621 start_codon:yes stop_codon:yes gene_type:complete
MQALYNFIIKPIGKRYNNINKVGDKDLIVNTEIFNHQYINREAKVLYVPKLLKTPIKVGDTVLIHHNVFRRWHNIRGEEKNSKSYINKDIYSVNTDQVYAYKQSNNWKSLEGYCFVKPIKPLSKLSFDKEQPLVGVMKYSDESLIMVEEGDLVGFTPNSEFEFIIDGEKLYRVLTSEISIKYEYQGQEEEYNPSWLQSSGRVNKSS